MTALLFIALMFAPYGAVAMITNVTLFFLRRRRDYYRRRLEALEQVGRLAAVREQWSAAIKGRINSGAKIRAVIPTRVHDEIGGE